MTCLNLNSRVLIGQKIILYLLCYFKTKEKNSVKNNQYLYIYVYMKKKTFYNLKFHHKLVLFKLCKKKKKNLITNQSILYI